MTLAREVFVIRASSWAAVCDTTCVWYRHHIILLAHTIATVTQRVTRLTNSTHRSTLRSSTNTSSCGYLGIAMAAEFSLSGINLNQHATTTAPAQTSCSCGADAFAHLQHDFEAFGPAQPGLMAATCAPCSGGFSHAQHQFADPSQNQAPGTLPSRLGGSLPATNASSGSTSSEPRQPSLAGYSPFVAIPNDPVQTMQNPSSENDPLLPRAAFGGWTAGARNGHLDLTAPRVSSMATQVGKKVTGALGNLMASLSGPSAAVTPTPRMRLPTSWSPLRLPVYFRGATFEYRSYDARSPHSSQRMAPLICPKSFEFGGHPDV